MISVLYLNGIEAPASSFAEYRMDANNPVPLIYQSGYLTIKDYDRRISIIIYLTFLTMRYATDSLTFLCHSTLQ